MAAVPMNTQHIKVTTRPPNKPPGILAALITTLMIFNVLPKVWSQTPLYWADDATPATAGGGTWTTFTGSGGSWSSNPTSDTGTAWEDGSVAHFLGSAGGTILLESSITAAGINFDPGASSFTIET